MTSYLQRTVAPRLFDQTLDRDGERVFAVAASLTEMAGWMAHDCGHDRLAQQHFERASSMAVAGRDHQLALQARGHTATGGSAACLDDLRQAEHVLASPPADAASPWASSYDGASLAVDTARCLHRIGQFGVARTQVEQVIGLRPPDRVRSRALAQLILVSILIAQHRPEEACGVARQALDATTALGSVQVFRQLEALAHRLEPYRGSRSVDDFVGCLCEGLRARRWMTRHLSVGADPGDTGAL